MKKVLLTSTALVMVAGAAAAEVSVSGSAIAGFKYDEDAADSTVLHYELDFGVSGSGETDSGLSFGASLDLDFDNETADYDDPEVFISGTFGTITVGEVDPATDPMGFSDVGFDGIGVDDNAETFRAMGNANILYEYSVDAFSFAFSTELDAAAASGEDDYAVLIGYDAGAVEIELGYATDDAGNGLGAEASAISLGVSGEMSGVSYSVFYHQAEGDGTGALGIDEAAGYGASVSFAAGAATTITVAAGDTDVAGDDADFGVGFEYDLGGGASIAGGVGSVGNLGDARTVADLGMSFSF